ncbi:unnamed protein product [Leuciscus chuanchicus]
MEPKAIEEYCCIQEVNHYSCGFIIHPDAPWLGSSPDGLVYDPKADPVFGLYTMLPTVMSGLGTGTTTNVHTSPLTRQSKQHNSLVKTVTDKLLLKDLDHLTECVHTTTLEVYHSMYLKYLPKRTHFGYDVMVHASMLAALDHNNNVNKEQAVYQDGESVGEPKFKIAWSKVHKTFRAKPVMTEKDYSCHDGRCSLL